MSLTDTNGPVPIVRPELGPCWIWNGSLTRDGYGKIKRSSHIGGITLAHKVPWEALHGEVPPGLQLDHLCRVRHCVNPAHLEMVTPRVNNERSFSPSALNAKKTHCQNGHVLTLDNTYIYKSGARNCKICKGELRRKATLKRNPDAGCAMKLKTHCPRGHEYTAENTRVYKGSRFCKACNKIFKERLRDQLR